LVHAACIDRHHPDAHIWRRNPPSHSRPDVRNPRLYQLTLALDPVRRDPSRRLSLELDSIRTSEELVLDRVGDVFD
jgi:hypothetical protein